MDTFEDLARFYDPLMEHVDYARWARACVAMAELLPDGFRHLDAGCGTGTLLARLHAAGWRSVGIDLSGAMLHTLRKSHGALPVARADLRALPFQGSLDFVTCLFDSLNFLLDDAGFQAAIGQIGAALRPGGIAYFDVVTERMVTDHFEDQDWLEDIGAFTARWASRYDRKTRIAETRIRINHGEASVIRERIYPVAFIEEACAAAGLKVLLVADASTWRPPNARTTRIDFVLMKDPPRGTGKRFDRVHAGVQARLGA
jgi:SAM-dependent methyltransferase